MTIDFSVVGGRKQPMAMISKPALVFVEGQHKDKKGTHHDFSRERVLNIIDNTNHKLSAGERIPFQKDHKKDSDNNIGDLEGPLYGKVITARDLPNPKYTNLIGKLGVFTDSLVARGKSAVDQVVSKSIKTLSAGIDPETESFIEISCTPFPAIAGMSLFSASDEDPLYFEMDDISQTKELAAEQRSKNPLSMEDALGVEKEATAKGSEFNKYAGALGKVLQELYSASDQTLKGKNPIKESYAALEFFNKKIEEVFELVEDEKAESVVSGLLPTKTIDPDVVKRRNNFSRGSGRRKLSFSRTGTSLSKGRGGRTITFGGKVK